MKYIVLHRSSHRMRIKVPVHNMSYRSADLMEYYLKNISEVKDASVDERTGNAIIYFYSSIQNIDQILQKHLDCYDEKSEKTLELLPEETGRRLNREYEDHLAYKILMHNLWKIVMPVSIRNVRTILKMTSYLIKAIKYALIGKLKVETLDGIALAASVLRRDFGTASSIMFLLDMGELLEEWTRKKSIGDLARAMSLNVDKVWLVNDGEELQVPVHKVCINDNIVLRRSDIIPLDGTIISGEVTVNQMTMTGESVPVLKHTGGYVYAGTVVEEGECIVEVAKEAGEGKYDQIVRMIEESEKLKSDTEEKAYRLADTLVPYSFFGFVATYLLTGNIQKALSFLMVDYSCAMKLSMPLAILSAIKEARNHGISIKGGKFMEMVSKADTIVFDKTGTLTYASPKLMEVVPFGENDADEMLRIAACLEEHYPHSIATAIVKGAQEKNLNHEELHSKVAYIVAHGVSSFIGDKKVVIGSYHFVMEDEQCILPREERYKITNINEEFSRVYLAIDGKLAAILCIFDPVRKETKAVLSQLQKLGIKNICMMTGDNQKTAKSVAESIGIDEYKAEVLPEDKAMYVRQMRKKGHTVIMVGDGVNDSPALSEADVGIAMDTGAAITREIADITIQADNLSTLVTLKRISDGLMKRINSNYRFIVGFNSALIALGVAEVINPATSALLHNGSTVLTGIKSMTNLFPTEINPPADSRDM